MSRIRLFVLHYAPWHPRLTAFIMNAQFLQWILGVSRTQLMIKMELEDAVIPASYIHDDIL